MYLDPKIEKTKDLKKSNSKSVKSVYTKTKSILRFFFIKIRNLQSITYVQYKQKGYNDMENIYMII